MTEHTPITVEEIIDHDAYEAHMHFLLPNDGYELRRIVLPEPTTDAVEKELVNTQQNDQLFMFADFRQYEKIGISPYDEKYIVDYHKVGERILSILPVLDSDHGQFTTLPEATESDLMTPFMALWLSCYAGNRARNFFGDVVRPIGSLAPLYAHPLLERDLVVGQKDEPPQVETSKERTIRLSRLALHEMPHLEPLIKNLKIPTKTP